LISISGQHQASSLLRRGKNSFEVSGSDINGIPPKARGRHSIYYAEQSSHVVHFGMAYQHPIQRAIAFPLKKRRHDAAAAVKVLIGQSAIDEETLAAGRLNKRCIACAHVEEAYLKIGL
jgi:hypothetical protein